MSNNEINLTHMNI